MHVLVIVTLGKNVIAEGGRSELMGWVRAAGQLLVHGKRSHIVLGIPFVIVTTLLVLPFGLLLIYCITTRIES